MKPLICHDKSLWISICGLWVCVVWGMVIVVLIVSFPAGTAHRLQSRVRRGPIAHKEVLSERRNLVFCKMSEVDNTKSTRTTKCETHRYLKWISWYRTSTNDAMKGRASFVWRPQSSSDCKTEYGSFWRFSSTV